MVITIILITIIFAQSFISMHYIFKSYNEGLKHNYELKHNIQPSETKTIVTEVKEHIDEKELAKQSEKMQKTIEEWLS
jgi:uncharacterized protein (UPF0332 family)